MLYFTIVKSFKHLKKKMTSSRRGASTAPSRRLPLDLTVLATNCLLGNAIESITGLGCTSSSASVNFTATLKDGITFTPEGASIPQSLASKRLFVKSFAVPAVPIIDPRPNRLLFDMIKILNEEARGSWQSMMYEIRVYNEIIYPIITTNECVNFVKAYGAVSCPLSGLRNMFIPSGVRAEARVKKADAFRTNYVKNVILNTYNRYKFSASGISGQPALTVDDDVARRSGQIKVATRLLKQGETIATTDTASCRLLDFPADRRAEAEGLINTDKIHVVQLFTEGINSTTTATLDAHLHKFKVESNEKFKTTPHGDVEMRNFIYQHTDHLAIQLLCLCYAMEVNGMVHNDIHSGNVWVEKLPEHILAVYVIEGEIYSVFTDVILKTYDFDRSYARRLGLNQIIRLDPGQFCEIDAQCNKLIYGKDAVKAFGYIHGCGKTRTTPFSTELKKIMIGHLTDSAETTAMIGRMYETNCFLNKAFAPDVFKRLGRIPTMMSRSFARYKGIDQDLEAEDAINILGVIRASNHDDLTGAPVHDLAQRINADIKKVKDEINVALKIGARGSSAASGDDDTRRARENLTDLPVVSREVEE